MGPGAGRYAHWYTALAGAPATPGTASGGAPRGDGPRLGRSGAAAAFPLRPPERHSTRAVLARKLGACRARRRCVGASHGHTQTHTFGRFPFRPGRARVANGSSRSRGSVGGLFPILSAGTTHHSPAVGRLPRRRVGWRVAVPGTGCGPLGSTYLRTCTLYLYALMRPLMISCLYFSISSSFSNVA
jgi:hypothetical protein